MTTWLWFWIALHFFSSSQFSMLGTTDIADWTLPWWVGRGGCHLYYRTFSGIAGFYPLDTNNTLLPHVPCSRQLKMSPESATVPCWGLVLACKSPKSCATLIPKGTQNLSQSGVQVQWLCLPDFLGTGPSTILKFKSENMNVTLFGKLEAWEHSSLSHSILKKFF